MQKKLFSITTVFCLITSGIFAQPKFIEKVERKGSEIVIPYEKYELPNGLTVVIHEDHSDPIVYVDVTYHVGSAREQEGRSGFAHFFEHMMFQGSEHVGDEQHFKLVTEAGGTLNGTTNTDRTNYFEVVPSNQLEVALWLEADRMGFLLDSVTQKKFEVQRATVKNERGQNYDNKPYGVALEKTNAALYPTNHPYYWLTIGYIEDLNRVDVNDLKKFFLRWYGPNNATLTVSGDVKPADVLKLAEKYFGPIPRGAEVKKQSVAPVVLDKDRYISYEDNIRLPQLSFTFPTVPQYHADEPALDVLMDIIGSGKSSIFYKNLVKTQKAQSAVAYHSTAELAGAVGIYVRTTAEHTLSEMEELVRSSLAEFEKRGVTDDDLNRYKVGTEVFLINTLSSVQRKGGTLAVSQTYTGSPNQLALELPRYMNVTKEDVIRVYEKYIKNKHAVILSIYPKGKSDLVAKPDNYTSPVRNTNAVEGEEYKKLNYVKAKDNFDRSKKPIPGASPVVVPPAHWTGKFSNGISYIGAKTTELPSVTVQLSIACGHRYTDPAKAGIASLTAVMMNEGTVGSTAEEITEKLERLGSSVSVSGDNENVVVYISSLTKNLDATMAIAEDILFNPRFAEADFDRVKKNRLEAIASQATQAPTIAVNVYSKLLYGKEHIMSLPALGTKESVAAITLEDVKQFYEKRLSADITRMVVVGDIEKDAAIAKLRFLEKWQVKTVPVIKEPALPVIAKTKLYFVNKDKAAQSEIRVGYMSMPFDATGTYYKSTVANHALGGAFNCRINLNLREKHGFTYGSRAGFHGSKFAGPYTGYAGVRTNATDSAVVELMKEIKLYADKGITKEELEFTKNSMGQGEALKYESLRQKAEFLGRIQEFGLAANYTETQNAILKSITMEEVNAIAKKNLPYDKMLIVVVGDKAKVFEGLLKLGYEIVELDTDGNPLVPVVKEDKMKEAEPTRAPNPQPPSNGQKRAKVVPIDPVRPVK